MVPAWMWTCGQDLVQAFLQESKHMSSLCVAMWHLQDLCMNVFRMCSAATGMQHAPWIFRGKVHCCERGAVVCIES